MYLTSLKTKQFVFLLTAVLFLCAFISPALARIYSGVGTAGDPFIISTAAEMYDIGNNLADWNNYFLLTADIDLSAYAGTQFNVIGDDFIKFTGVFDGNGHTILNFTYNSTGTDYIGIFSNIRGAEIKNTGLIDPNINAGTGNYIGSLVSYMSGFYSEGPSPTDNILFNCYVEGGKVDGNDAVGGLVGFKESGTIRNCYSTCTVSGNKNVGGLLGVNEYGYLTSCYSSGSASATTRVGGLIGVSVEAQINDCHSTAAVVGDDYVGGLAGSGIMMSNCYSAGSVSGSGDNVGGLVGSGWGYITDCFWDVNTSGEPNSPGGIGKTTVEMQDPNTFMDAGWDFVGKPDGPGDIWAEPVGGGYPVLAWQLSPLPSLPTFSGGSGQPNNPYLISTAQQLNSIGYNPRLMDGHFRLVNDIDLTGTDFFIIGSDIYPFAGSFDGDGHRVSNFTYNSTDLDSIGFFSSVSGISAVVKNLGLIDPNVDAGTGTQVGSLIGSLWSGSAIGCYAQGGRVLGSDGSPYADVGGLVGQNNGSIIDCHASTIVTGGGRNVGGLIGLNFENVSNSYATGSVFGGDDIVGGLVGGNIVGIIWNCYSSSNVSGVGDDIGGLVGENFGDITNSYSSGDISGNSSVGGLVGLNLGNDYATVSKCYSFGTVSGNASVGGMVGWNTGVIGASLWDKDTSLQSSMCGRQDHGGSGCNNANGKTTAEMQDQDTFINTGWDFWGESDNGTDDIWRMCFYVPKYPKLLWEYSIADFVCPDGVDTNDLAVFVEQWLLEKLSADIDSDGFVDLFDWAVFAGAWQSTTGSPTWNPKCDIDPAEGDGIVDANDLGSFVNQWLQLSAYSADIAPAPDGDKKVDMFDFATLAQNWLLGLE